jgi:hypothetical protein
VGVASDAKEREWAGSAALNASGLRILGVHGVGGHPAGGAWERDWRDGIHRGLDLLPGDAPPIIDFVHYDDICTRYPVSAWDVAKALAKLIGSAALAPTRQTRGFGSRARLTAGMVVQWVENDGFRSDTRVRLAERIADTQPDVVLGHSLGSLVCYDAFTHTRTARFVEARDFVSLGSQIDNPFVSGQFPTGRVQPLEQARHWFHLFNPHDDAFTAEIRLPAETFTQVETRFNLPGFGDHDASRYLGHRQAAQHMWPRILRR